MQISIELECVWLSSEEKGRFSNYCFISFKLLVFFSCRFRFDVRQQFFLFIHTHIYTRKWPDGSTHQTLIQNKAKIMLYIALFVKCDT